MQQPTCRVSVVIPLFNSAATLRRAVASVQSQTLQDFELFIVDDASQDDSMALARELAAADARLRVIPLPGNRGKSHAMNTAIAEARGAWIAVLDADDWFEPNRLADLVAVGEARGAALVADNQNFWDGWAGTSVRTAFPSAQGDTVLTRQAFITGSDPYAAFDHGMLKPVVRAEFIHGAGLRYRENARLSEDFLYLVDFFAAGGTGIVVAEPYYNWTQPFGSISRRWTTTGAGEWRYDYASAIAACMDAVRDMRARHDTALAGLLVRRIRAFRRLHHLGEISRLRADGARPARVALAVLRHPSVWSRLAVRLARGLRRPHGNASARVGTSPISLRQH